MNGQNGCCDWFFRCFKGSSSTENKEIANNTNHLIKQRTLPIEQPQPDVNNDANYNTLNRPPEEVNNQNVAQEPEPEINMPIINTKYKAEDIISNVTPDKIKEIKYNCPICFKFYNHILVLKCCNNYICLPCITNHIDTSKKYAHQLKCPICTFSEKLNLEDVNPNLKVRYYSDTLYASITKPIVNVKTMNKMNLTRKETKVKRAITKQHKLLRRKYSIENGVLFDLNKHSKIDVLKSQTIQHLRQNPTRKKDYIYDQTGVINKPDLKNTVEIDNIEINFKKDYRTKSKINQTISHQSAYSFSENNFEINSQIDDEGEDFYFERDNDNNLIEILEMKIQNDILIHEKKRNKVQFDSEPNFRTVKLKEMESRSQGENEVKNGYLRKQSMDFVSKNIKTEEEARVSVYLDDKVQIEEENPDKEENKEIEDINEIVDFDQLYQGSVYFNSKNGEKSQNPSLINIERSEDKDNRHPFNKTEEVIFDTVSRKLNFDVLKID